MLYDVETPELYFSALEADWRKDKLLKVHEMLLEAAPEFELCISYKMLGYGCEGRDNLFNLNAQKNYVGLYVGHISKIDTTGELLSGYDCGKGCIRLKKTTDLTDPNLSNFIAKAVKLWREGAELGC